MYNKKLIFGLILLIFAIGAVNAVDSNSTDEIAIDNSESFNETVVLSENTEASESIAPEGNGNDSAMDEENESSAVIEDTNLKLSASKLTTTYGNSKYFKVTVKDSKNNPVSGIKVQIKINGKTYTRTSNENGIASFNTKNIAKGTYSVKTSIVDDVYTAKAISSKIKVNAKKLTIITESGRIKEKYYSAAGVAIQIKDKSTKKAINGVKLTLKIYTGKKYKTIKVVTGKVDNRNGICGIFTNKFSVGTHKVVIKPTSKNYIGTKTVKIKIIKADKKCYYNHHYVYITNGKTKTNMG